MNSYFADLLSEKILKSEDMSQRRIFILNSVWSREYNRGTAFSLSEYARFWKIPERTVRHYAAKNILPGLVKKGKRLKIRKTKFTFNYGLFLCKKKYEKDLKSLTSISGDFAISQAALLHHTKNLIYHRQAHDKTIKNIQDIDLESYNVLLGRMLGFTFLENDDPVSIKENIQKNNPDDPFLSFSEPELEMHNNQPKVMAWASIAACLAQSGIRPTRKRIAERMGISRSHFSRLFPEAKWANIKASISILINSIEPIINNAKKNRGNFERLP
jgi:AraC-like DNA-binding protein